MPSDMWKRFAGFFLKYENGRFSGSGITTIGNRFDPFGPKNSDEKLEGRHDVNSRQSEVQKALSSFD
jgi:hypothetical protein